MPLLVEQEQADDVLAALETVFHVKAGRPGHRAADDPETPLEWAERHRRIDGRAFSLERFRPLRAIYADDHPHTVVIKPAQRGVSEWAINVTGFALEHGAAAWAPEKDGLNIGYVFPTQDALRDFSKERFSGLKDESAHLAALFGGSEFDGVTFKQVGRSYLYLRGGWSTAALRSFAADVLILDEYDELDPEAIALARRRLNASLVKRELDISTPTLPGKGVHALYLQSDQRVYEQPCPRCGAWNRYDFFRDVRADDQPHAEWQRWPPERLRRARVELRCPACREPLSDADQCAAGRWAAQAPEVEGLRGYWIPPLAFPFVSLQQLAVAAVGTEPSEVQEFYRSDLGLPYQAGGSRVTESMLKQLGADLPGGRLPDLPDTAWRDTTMGVDVGARLHYRVSSLGGDAVPYIRAMGSVAAWADLDGLMERYRVRLCVVDALPELHACRAWQEQHQGRVLRALYPSADSLAGRLFAVNEDEGLVRINRTAAMDTVWAAVSGARERWPAAIHNDPEVVAHMTAPVRVTVEDKHGQEQASWVHTSPDHLYHASVYDLIARRALPVNETIGVMTFGGARGGWFDTGGRR